MGWNIGVNNVSVQTQVSLGLNVAVVLSVPCNKYKRHDRNWNTCDRLFNKRDKEKGKTRTNTGTRKRKKREMGHRSDGTRNVAKIREK